MSDPVRDADLASIQILVMGMFVGGVLFAWRGWTGFGWGMCVILVVTVVRHLWPNR